jgi:hypothetical protein
MSHRYIFVTGADVADVDAASHQASARYRILLPGRALRDDGLRVAVWPLGGAPDPSEIGPGDRVTVVQLKADSKRVEDRRRLYVSLVEAAHARAGCLRFDISNYTNNFDELDRYVISLADMISVPSEGMRQILGSVLDPQAAGKLTVIEDAYEMPYGATRFEPAPGLVRALWFGFPSAEHITALCEAIRLLETQTETSIALQLVSMPGLEIKCAELVGPLMRVHLSLTPWSVEATSTALAACDVVLLPGSMGASTLAKSHNRLVETLRSGRLALCAPLPAYQELADYCCVGDIAESLAWALHNPEAVQSRIRAGQTYVETRFAPTAVAKKWVALSDRLATERGKSRG